MIMLRESVKEGELFPNTVLQCENEVGQRATVINLPDRAMLLD